MLVKSYRHKKTPDCPADAEIIFVPDEAWRAYLNGEFIGDFRSSDDALLQLRRIEPLLPRELETGGWQITELKHSSRDGG